jgi:hypothetical protein
MQEHFKNQKEYRDTQIPFFISDRKTRIISPKNIFSRLIGHANMTSHKRSVIANANGFHSRLYTRSVFPRSERSRHVETYNIRTLSYL